MIIKTYPYFLKEHGYRTPVRGLLIGTFMAQGSLSIFLKSQTLENLKEELGSIEILKV